MDVNASATNTPDVPRTQQQVREHYELERELAARLRDAPAEERPQLYSALYDELFARLPHHPQLTRKASPAQTAAAVAAQMSLLGRFLQPHTSFLELGPGDCSLSVAVAERVGTVYAADVSTHITTGFAAPANFHLVQFDGTRLPLPDDSIDVAYSHQLIEHLHPDDAAAQLGDVRRVLRPGGAYVCITPHRYSGPHDVSRYFDDEATGFHLKEYTVTELRDRFRAAGFSRCAVYAGGGGAYVGVPSGPVVLAERLLASAPRHVARALASRQPLRAVFGIRVVGRK